jgi:hypothetical protein
LGCRASGSQSKLIPAKGLPPLPDESKPEGDEPSSSAGKKAASNNTKGSQLKDGLSFSSGKGKATIGANTTSKSLGKRKVIGGDGDGAAPVEKTGSKKKKKEKKGLLSFGDGED